MLHLYQKAALGKPLRGENAEEGRMECVHLCQKAALGKPLRGEFRREKNGMCSSVPKGRIGEASQRRVEKREECQNAVLGKCIVGVSSLKENMELVQSVSESALGKCLGVSSGQRKIE